MAVAAPGAQGLAVHSPAVTQGEEVGSGATARSATRPSGKAWQLPVHSELQKCAIPRWHCH